MKSWSFLSLTLIFMIIMAPVAFASSITNYTYDPNGNMLSDGEFDYTYNAANQMVMAVEADTGDFVEEYFYDHSGNRVKKIESATGGNKTTYYISELYEITVEPDGTMTNTTYVYANGERVARNETNENGSTVFYYHSDHLHSTSVVTTNGNLMANLTEANSTWTTIQMNKSLSRPIVIAKITSESETDNSEVRITNTSSDSFVVKIEETEAFDGTHTNETISYIALEQGIIANGADTLGEAGTIDAGPIWTRVTFQERFETAPIVAATAMTANSNDAGTIRIKNIGTTGFDVRFEEYSGGDHPLETIGWMAVKQGTHTLDGKTIVAGSTSVNSNYSSVSLSGFSNPPAVITQIQSYNEGDYGSHTRVNNTKTTGFDVKIEEQNDTSHTTETIGYIAIEPTVIKSGSAKVEETKYYPYGVIQEGGNERYLYTGKEMDTGTGLYYYEARYYNSRIGRFVQADIMVPNLYNPQYLNRYSYVLNNPLRYIDPSGYDPNQLQMGTPADISSRGTYSDAMKHFRSFENHNDATQVAYIYSETFGPIDLLHFSWAASATSGEDFIFGMKSSPENVLKFGDKVVEGGQWFVKTLVDSFPSLGKSSDFLQGQWHSADSYEDFPSNYLGAAFGYLWREKKKTMSFGEYVDWFSEEIDAVEFTEEDIEMWQSNPTSAPGWFSNLPKSCSFYNNPKRSRTSGFGGNWFGNTYIDRYGRVYERNERGSLEQVKD